jgi:hypothetical protein
MELQRQQFDQQMAIQREQMAEQKRIAEAPAPPAPAPTAMAAASAVEVAPALRASAAPMGGAGAAAAGADMAIPIRSGIGRRRLRTDIAGGAGGLSIPAS